MNLHFLLATALALSVWATAAITTVEASRTGSATQTSGVAAAKPTPALSADQIYKANCTRCHSELPKLKPSAMKTVLMHMRVRGNIPKDDARALVEYLTR